MLYDGAKPLFFATELVGSRMNVNTGIKAQVFQRDLEEVFSIDLSEAESNQIDQWLSCIAEVAEVFLVEKERISADV